jgi:multiple sugar transport system substrate-binding protein
MHDSTGKVQLSRRQFLRRVGLASAGLAALPILAACGTSLATPAPSAAPAGGGTGASTAPSTAASTAPSTAASAAPAASGSAAPAASVAPTPTAIAGINRPKSSAQVTGKYQFIQNQDFHPDHNAFLRAEIQEFCKVQGWQLDISYAAGFTGNGDLLTALIGAVQAGNAPDAFFHDIGVRQYQSQGVLDPTTDLTKELIAQKGATYPGYEDATLFDNEWWGVPFYGRAGGMYVRKDIYTKFGLDPVKDSDTYDKLRETALKISDPDNKMWGWGVTINRSGDGNTNVQQPLLRYGMRLQDETGQLIKFNSPETIKGLNWLKETYTDPKWAKMLPPGINSWTDLSNNEAFLAGTIAITDNAGTMYAKAVLDKVPFAKDIIAIPRPKRVSDGQYLDSLAGARFHVIKGSKNKAASYDLFRHLLSDPVMDQLLKISPGYVLPPYKNGWQNPLVQNDANAKASEPLAYPTGDRFTGLRYPGPSSAAVDAIGGGNYFTDMAAEVIQGKSAEEVAKNYHDRFIQIFKDFGLKGS